MGQTTIEMDDLVDELSLLPDADAASWPSIEITIDYKTHPAEPDVDIFNEQLEIQRVTYNLDGTDYRDEDAFVSALYEHIAGDIENDESTVRAKIAAQIDAWEESYEGEDDDGPEYDRDED